MATGNLNRLRQFLRIPGRTSAVCPSVLMDGERTDRDIAVLAKAEREFRQADWQRRSILGGSR